MTEPKLFVMKTISYFLIILLGLVGINTGNSYAQGTKIGVHLGTTDYSGDRGTYFYEFRNPRRLAGGVTIHKFLSPSFDIELAGMMGAIDFRRGETPLFYMEYINWNILNKYKFNNGYMLSEDAVVQPYANFGIGGVYFEEIAANGGSKVAFNIPFGGGLGLKITDRLTLDLNTMFNYPLFDDFDGLAVGGTNDWYLINTAGLVYNIGSMDEDNDGVRDKFDLCPATPADIKVDLTGCPVDRDGDGVLNDHDQCPDVAGSAALLGCPDRDADGIADKDDQCPELAGSRTLMGCPDADGDGIRDSEDKCPKLAGPKSLEGCPDSDGDGVADNRDKCPAEKGDMANDGCPKVEVKTVTITRMLEDQKLIDAEVKNIQFETGKDRLLPSSYPSLQKVVTILKNMPEYKLKIHGHTDAVGDAQANHTLSHKRADAVRNFLMGNGIDKDRMSIQGFGETKPVASNNLATGKALNRRVEMILH